MESSALRILDENRKFLMPERHLQSKISIKVMILFVLFLVLLSMLLIPTISALDFDNYKEFNISNGKYGEITIKNNLISCFLGLGCNIASYKLEEYNSSIINAYAKGRAILYEKGQLFTGQEFINKEGKKVNLKDAKMFILTNEEYTEEKPVYEYLCEKIKDEKNGTTYNSCQQKLVETKKETKSKTYYKDYNYEELPAGDYEWKITAKRPVNTPIDFVLITGFGDFKTTEWSWWNTGWSKKKKITIQENQAINYANYSVLMNITYDADMRSDFGDLRFTNNLETQELDYWINDSVASSVAHVWVKVPSMPASAETTIYMYYGNAAVTNNSNYFGAFLFADDFNDGSWTGNWTNINTGGGINETNGFLNLTGGAGSTMGSVLSKGNYTDDDGGWWILESQWKYYMPTAAQGSIGVSDKWNSSWDYADGTENVNSIFMMWANAQWRTTLYINGVYSFYESGINLPDPTSSMVYTGVVRETNKSIFYDLNSSAEITERTGMPTSNSSLSMGLFLWARDENNVASYDWVRLRRYAVSEPTVTFGTETSQIGVDVNLTAPSNYYNISVAYQNFNATCIPLNVNWTNATLYVWWSNTSLFETKINTITGNVSNATSFNLGGLISGNYTWNVLCRGIDKENMTNIITNFATSNRSISSNYTIFSEISQSFNATTYVGNLESYTINLTYANETYSNISASLFYNGVSYSGTQVGSGSNIRFIKTNLLMAEPSGNKNFNWEFTLTNSTGTEKRNSSIKTQTVYVGNFSICMGASNNVTYINLTFKDEVNSSYISAKTDLATWSYYLSDGSISSATTYLFTNTSQNLNYPYCFSPPDKTINYSVTYQYSASGYPQRSASFSGSLTNTTTDKTLYLLSSTDGIYSSFQIVTSGGAVITGANVTLERQFSGVWEIIGTSTSDGSGLTTFWVNPNYDHKLTVTKLGYVTYTTTIRPTQSIYTVTMTSSTTTAYNNTLEGIIWIRGPNSGALNSGVHQFYFNVTSSKCNMVNCMMQLINESGWIVATANANGTCSSNMSINYNFIENELKGFYYVNLGQGYILVESDGDWKKISTNISHAGTIRDLFNYISNPDYWLSTPGDFNSDEYRKYEFTKIVAFFLILSIIIAALNISFNFETINPNIFLFGFPLIVLILSIAGGINGYGFFYIKGATPFGRVFDNLVVAFYSLIISAAIFFNALRRGG